VVLVLIVVRMVAVFCSKNPQMSIPLAVRNFARLPHTTGGLPGIGEPER